MNCNERATQIKATIKNQQLLQAANILKQVIEMLGIGGDGFGAIENILVCQTSHK